MNETTLDRVLQAVRDISVERGIAMVTRAEVAARVGLSETQISRLSAATPQDESGMRALTKLAVKQAVRDGDAPMVSRAVQAGALSVGRGVHSSLSERYPDLIDPRGGSPYSPVYRAAYEMALESGLHGLSRAAIAERAGVSDGTVSKAFGSMDEMPNRLVAWGVELHDAKMVARGIQIDSPTAALASPELRRQAAEWLAK